MQPEGEAVRFVIPDALTGEMCTFPCQGWDPNVHKTCGYVGGKLLRVFSVLKRPKIHLHGFDEAIIVTTCVSTLLWTFFIYLFFKQAPLRVLLYSNVSEI